MYALKERLGNGKRSVGYCEKRSKDWVWFVDTNNLITGGGKTEDEARECFIDTICRTIAEDGEPESRKYFQDLLARICQEMGVTPEWQDGEQEKEFLRRLLQITDECGRVLWRWKLGLESPEAAEAARKTTEQIRQKTLQLLRQIQR
jgi:hypothetical protein